MSTHLLPCSGCARHVRATDATCPFCGEALPLSLRQSATPATPTARLGRTALFAFGVALTGATMLGCGDDDGPTPGTDSGTTMADSGGGGTDAGGGGLDAGGGGTDAGGGGLDAGGGGTDAGGGGTDSGGPAPLYGAAPVDSGPMQPDAGGGGPAPLYGAPPMPA